LGTWVKNLIYTSKGLAFLVYLLLTPLISYQLADLVWEKEFSALKSENENTSKLFSHNLQNSLQQNEIASKLIARSELIIQLLAEGGDIRTKQANDFLNEINSSIEAGVIYIMSTKGITISSSNWYEKNSFVGKNYSFRPYFKKAIKGQSFAYTALGITSGKLGYYYATPVKQNNKIVGVVVVKTNLSNPSEFMSTNEEKVVVTDPNGVIILTTEPNWELHTLHAIDAATKRSILKSRQYIGASLQAIEMIQLESNRLHSLVKIEQNDFVKVISHLKEQNWQLVTLTNTQVANRLSFLTALATGLTGTIFFLIFLYYLGHRGHLAELHELSIRDSLTGLYNRRHMIDISAVAASQPSSEISSEFVTVMIDIDHFKQINDNYGHAAGDLVLQKVSKVIRRNMRAEDLAVRYGGEEFVLLFASLNKQNDTLLVERIKEHIKELRFSQELDALRISVSAGIAYHKKGETFDETVARADALMYKAKNTGRDRIVSDQDK